jgi:hypothetical protein
MVFHACQHAFELNQGFFKFKRGDSFHNQSNSRMEGVAEGSNFFFGQRKGYFWVAPWIPP